MSETSTSRQAMWVAIGQFFSFAIGIISPMILSRYFNKGDYGTYKQVMYIYQTLLTVFTLGLPKAYAYFIPRVSLAKSKDVINKVSGIFLVLGVLFSIFLFLFAGPIAKVMKNPDLELALRWFAPTPLFLLPVMGLEGIMASYKKTQYLAIYTIVTKVFTLTCILLPVLLFRGTYIHAIVGFDVASLLTFLLSLYLRNLPTKGVPLEKAEVTHKEIFSFALPLFAASIWGIVITSSDQFFVSRYFGNESFAEFSNGFMEFPIIHMVVGAVATVLLPLFSGMSQHDKEDIVTVWTTALLKSAKVIYPITTYCICFAGLTMVCFYGSLYENSGVFFALKNFVAYFAIIPFFPIITALGKTKEYSLVIFLNAILVVGTEFAIVKLSGTAYVIGMASVFYQILRIFIMMFIVASSMNITIKQLIPAKLLLGIILVTILSIIPSLALYYFFPSLNKFVLLFITVSLYFLTYYGLCWLFHISYKDVIVGFLNKGQFKSALKYIP